jgi:hypothetical protein
VVSFTPPAAHDDDDDDDKENKNNNNNKIDITSVYYALLHYRQARNLR